MKNFWNKFRESGLLMFAIMLLCAVFGIAGVDAVAADAAPAAVPSAVNGKVESSPADEFADLDGGGALGEDYQSLAEAVNASPNLVTRKVHDEVIKIAPYDYTTMSLMSKNFKIKKRTNDHKIAVYSVTTPSIQLKVATAPTDQTELVKVDFGADNRSVNINQNIIFPDVHGYKSDGTTDDGHCLSGTVVSFDGSMPVLKFRNGKIVGGVKTIPIGAGGVKVGTRALRGLRTGSETQIRTKPFNVYPTDKEFYVQKNIIEFGVTGWFNKATKEVKWTDRDRFELAMNEKLRTSMPDFWLGTQGQDQISTQYNGNAEELIFYKEGIWTQAGREFDFNGTIDVSSIIEFGKYVFTGNRSSNVKYFAMGSILSAEFQKVIFNNPTMLGETYRDKELNINFTAINFFGGKKILFADDPSLDDMGMGNCGMLLDHRYAWEESYGLMTVEIDGIKLANSDTKGQSIVEENCYILANNEAHCRVIF